MTYAKNLKNFQKKNSYDFLKICRILSLQKLVTKINSMDSGLSIWRPSEGNLTEKQFWNFFSVGKLDLGQSSLSIYFFFIAQFSEWVVFLVHGTIIQHWIPLLKNRASTEKIVLTVPVNAKLSCRRLLNNCTSDCLLIMSVIVKESCRRLLNNHKGTCCTNVLATVEELWHWFLNNRVRDFWTLC